MKHFAKSSYLICQKLSEADNVTAQIVHDLALLYDKFINESLKNW